MRSFRATFPDARTRLQHLRLTSLCRRIDTITFLYTHASVSWMSARSLGSHCLAMRVCARFFVLRFQNQHCPHLHSHHERKYASTRATAHTQATARFWLPQRALRCRLFRNGPSSRRSTNKFNCDPDITSEAWCLHWSNQAGVRHECMQAIILVRCEAFDGPTVPP